MANPTGTAHPSFEIRPWGTTPAGEEVLQAWLTNAAGMQVGITNYGGILTHLLTPDRNGELADVVLGYNQLEPYFNNGSYFGALIGRFGNRIGGGGFTLNGTFYPLAANNFPNDHPCHLHGGTKGWDQVVWQALGTLEDGVPTLVLTHHSPDGDEGYPGAVEVQVTYRLLPENALEIQYEARTDAATPINLTNHAYFNLAGEGSPSISEHVLQMAADRIVAIDPGSIPTGELPAVAGTAFDFTAPKAIGLEIDADETQIANAGGYDHTFVAATHDGTLRSLATVRDPSSGRIMQTLTTEPGVQFYSGNFLDGSLVGKAGQAYPRRSGFCLETQHFPDSPNRPEFPSTILQPGEVYRSTTVYRFSAE